MNFSKDRAGNGVSKNEIPGSRVAMSRGYITIPDTFADDRETYTQNCYRRERVDIVVEDGGTFKPDCYITRQALKDIEFPSKSKKLGSAIIFFQEPYYGQIVVIGTLSKNDETSLLKEGVFELKKYFEGNRVNIKGDAQTGQITIGVEGTKGGAQMDINIRNFAQTAKLNVNVRGEVNLNIKEGVNITSEENEIKIKSKKDINVTSEEGDINLIPTSDGKKLNIGEGAEALLLGDTTQTQLDNEKQYVSDLVTAISAALGTVDAAAGSASKTSFDLTMSGYQQGDFSGIKSEKGFTD